MTRILLFLGLLTLAPSSARLTDSVTITGVAKDCLPNQEFDIEGVDVSIFDPTENEELTSLLRSISAIDLGPDGIDPDGWKAVNHQFGELLVKLAVGRPASRTVTDSLGRFNLTVPAMDSALVLAYDHNNDADPLPYVYELLGARRDTTILLDMSGGQCTSMFGW